MGAIFGSAPKPPDPIKTAETQAKFNREAQGLTLSRNALDRFGPFGGSAVFQRDEGGLPTGQTVSFGAPLEQASQQTQGAVQDLTRFLPQDQFRLSDVPTGLDLSQSFFDQQQALFAPGRAREDKRLELRADERGLPIGSEPRSDLFAPALEQRAFQDAQAAGTAIQLAPQEQQRQIQNVLLERGQPTREALDATGLLNQLPAPSFAPQPSAGVAAPDFESLQQAEFLAKQRAAEQKQAAIGGLLGAGATLLTGGAAAPLFGGLGSIGGAFGGGLLASGVGATAARGLTGGFNSGEFENRNLGFR